jgi:hypothetical protein
VQTLDFVYSELRYDLCVHAPLYGGYLDANVVSLTVLLEFLRVPRVSEHPHEYVVVFSVIVVVVSRATLSISFPLVVVYFTFSIRIVCIHFYRLYHVCRYPSLPSHGHRSFQSPWAVLGQCRTTTTTRCIGQCLFHSSASLCPLPDTKAICDPLPVKIHSPFQQTSSEVSLKTWWVSGLIFSSLGLV